MPSRRSDRGGALRRTLARAEEQSIDLEQAIEERRRFESEFDYWQSVGYEEWDYLDNDTRKALIRSQLAEVGVGIGDVLTSPRKLAMRSGGKAILKRMFPNLAKSIWGKAPSEAKRRLIEKIKAVREGRQPRQPRESQSTGDPRYDEYLKHVAEIGSRPAGPPPTAGGASAGGVQVSGTPLRVALDRIRDQLRRATGRDKNMPVGRRPEGMSDSQWRQHVRDRIQQHDRLRPPGPADPRTAYGNIYQPMERITHTNFLVSLGKTAEQIAKQQKIREWQAKYHKLPQRTPEQKADQLVQDLIIKANLNPAQQNIRDAWHRSGGRDDMQTLINDWLTLGEYRPEADYEANRSVREARRSPEARAQRSLERKLRREQRRREQEEYLGRTTSAPKEAPFFDLEGRPNAAARALGWTKSFYDMTDEEINAFMDRGRDRKDTK